MFAEQYIEEASPMGSPNSALKICNDISPKVSSQARRRRGNDQLLMYNEENALSSTQGALS